MKSVVEKILNGQRNKREFYLFHRPVIREMAKNIRERIVLDA